MPSRFISCRRTLPIPNTNARYPLATRSRPTGQVDGYEEEGDYAYEYQEAEELDKLRLITSPENPLESEILDIVRDNETAVE